MEFTALINVRPSQGNAAIEVQDPDRRERIRRLTRALIGPTGDPTAHRAALRCLLRFTPEASRQIPLLAAAAPAPDPAPR